MSARTSVPLGNVLVDAAAGFACGEDVLDGTFQFRMNNVTAEGRISLAKQRRVPSASRSMKRFLLEPGDVLFNATNSPDLVGKTAYFAGLDEPAVFSNHFLRLRPQPQRLDGRYLSRWLQFEFSRGRFRALCRQWVNQATVSREALLGLSLPLLGIEDQRRSADLLERADELRAKRRAALAQLDALTEAIFLDMFGDPVANSMRWPEGAVLGDIAEIVSGITKGRALNGQSARLVPYLAVANVHDRRLNMAHVKAIAATEAEIARYKLERDDLLLTEGGDPDKLGRGTLWTGELPECIHQNHVFRVRIASKDVHPLFLNWLVGSQRGKRYFLRSAKQTTGIASINMTQLRGFPLLLPPLKLQQTFAARAARVDEMRGQYSRSLGALDALFASLQHRTFRGEL